MKCFVLSMILCLFAAACGSTNAGSSATDKESPSPIGPGGLSPATAGAGGGLPASEGEQRFVIDFSAVYDRNSECKNLACLGEKLGSNVNRSPDDYSSGPGYEQSRTRYVFSEQVELHCVYKRYLVAEVVDASCQMIFNLAGKDGGGVVVSRGNTPFANVFGATIKAYGIGAFELGKIGDFVSGRKILPEPELEVPLQSGRIARIPRLNLTCEVFVRDSEGKEIYHSCTFTGVATPFRS